MSFIFYFIFWLPITLYRIHLEKWLISRSLIVTPFFLPILEMCFRLYLLFVSLSSFTRWVWFCNIQSTFVTSLSWSLLFLISSKLNWIRCCSLLLGHYYCLTTNQKPSLLDISLLSVTLHISFTLYFWFSDNFNWQISFQV